MQMSQGASGENLSQNLIRVGQALESAVMRQEQIQTVLLAQAQDGLSFHQALTGMDRRISKTTNQMGRLERLMIGLINELRGPA
jgi:hypothetical protein